MDLSSLTPEEIAELKQALAEPPEDPIKVLASALELLMSKVESIEEKVDGVCKVVYDDIIGGVKDLASEQERTSRIDGLKSKYGELFSPHSAYLKDHLDGDADGIYPLLADRLDELGKGEGYTDEMGDAEIQRIAKEIADRVAALTGKTVVAQADGAPPSVSEPDGAKAPEPPKEEKKEEPKKEEPPKEEDPMKSVKDHIGKLKDRAGQAA